MSYRPSCVSAAIAANASRPPGGYSTTSAKPKPKQVPRERVSRLKQGERRLRQEWELDGRVNAEYERWRARGISADGRRFGGRDPDPYVQPESPQGIANATDPGSRKVKTPRGYMQG